jgi:hypothetical protein
MPPIALEVDSSIIYIDTSTMFMKTYCDVVLEWLRYVHTYTVTIQVQCDIIFVKRNLYSLIQSMFNCGWFEFEEEEKRWESVGSSGFIYDASEVNFDFRCTQPLHESNEMTRMEKIISYIIDFYKREELFQTECTSQSSNTQFHYINLEKFNTIENVIDLFQSVDLIPQCEPSVLQSTLDIYQHNTREEHIYDVSIEEVKMEVEKYYEELRDVQTKKFMASLFDFY